MVRGFNVVPEVVDLGIQMDVGLRVRRNAKWGYCFDFSPAESRVLDEHVRQVLYRDFIVVIKGGSLCQ